jgi:hypothetical protein
MDRIILRRVVGLAVAFGALSYASTIGNPVVSAAEVDMCSGCMFVLAPFSASDSGSTLTSWEFYAFNAADSPSVIGNQITPLLFSQTGPDFTIVGVGATQTITATGDQSYAFGLVSGSDVIGSSSYFGWFDGSLSATNTGTIAFASDGGTPSFVRDGTPVVGFTDPFAPLSRTYSVQATDSFVEPVPEPGTLGLLFGGGALVLLGRVRRSKSR